MTKIILGTYVKHNKPPPEHTRPSFKLKEVNAISKSRRERLLRARKERYIGEIMVDLIDTLERTLSPLEIVELLKNSTFNQEEIDQYAIKHNICPKCWSELRIHRWQESREHFGYLTNEEMSELQCDSCGWTID